jgi:uncharacterized membrane protein YjdF
MVVIVWLLDLQLPLQSVPVTINVVSSNPVHCEVYSITLCEKVYQWLTVGRLYSLGILVYSTIKTDCHDTAEILLKVALIIITLTLNICVIIIFFWIVSTVLYVFVFHFIIRMLVGAETCYNAYASYYYYSYFYCSSCCGYRYNKYCCR